MTSPREVLEKIYRDGLDGEKSPEEYDIDQALADLSEIVMGLKKKHYGEDKRTFTLPSQADSYNQAITDIASLFTSGSIISLKGE